MRRPATAAAVTPVLTYASVVGQVVERLRKQRGITQTTFAMALGITQPAYSRLEQGQSTLNVIQLGEVAAHLNTTPAEILKQADLMANQLRRAGVEITADKEISGAALLVGLGILAALFAALK